MSNDIDINEATKKKTLETANHIVNAYYDFLKKYRLGITAYNIDFTIVKDVARRYAYDVTRLHIFHKSPQPELMPLINRYKIAGYLAYWLCKLRPICLIDKNKYFSQNASPHLYINEAFAIYLAVGRLKAERLKVGVTGKDVLGKELMDAMLYGLRYRAVTGDMLSMAFNLIEERSIGKQPQNHF